MSLNISIINHNVGSISILDSKIKIIDLDLYERDLSLVEFKSLFYDNNYDYFRPNKFDKNADVLVLKNHTLDDISFNLLYQVIECYENELNIEETCWDPLKKMNLIKNLISLETLYDFKKCFNKALKYSEIKKIIEHEKILNNIYNFIAVIPIQIISGTQELSDIIFNLRINIVDL